MSGSRKSKTRVASLIRREKTVGLSQDETDELNHFMQIEHIMRLAKARAAFMSLSISMPAIRRSPPESALPSGAA